MLPISTVLALFAGATGFLAVVLVGIRIAAWLRDWDRRDSRLASIRARNPAHQSAAADSEATGSLTGERTDALGRLGLWLGARMRPVAVAGQQGVASLRDRLNAAGIYGDYAVPLLLAAKLAGALGLAAAGVLLRDAVPGLPEGALYDTALVIGLALLGGQAPELLLDRVAKQRARRIADALPDAMDLLVICAEAGLTLESAIARVGEEMREASPELGRELERTAADIRIAPSRVQAIQNLADRTRVAEVRSVASTLMQGQRYGTPLSRSLRALSQEFRTRRTRQVEEKAQKLPTMMTLPLILLIMPALFIVLMGPAILQVIQQFG
jgi:tight adherence protein C